MSGAVPLIYTGGWVAEESTSFPLNRTPRRFRGNRTPDKLKDRLSVHPSERNIWLTHLVVVVVRPRKQKHSAT